MAFGVHIYGQFGDHSSIPNISRAICRELHRRHVRFSVRGTGAIAPKYEDCPWPLALNSHAPVGVYIGYPGAAPNWLKEHETKCLVTVCETNKIPDEWVSACLQVDYVFVPSKFCRQVFIDSGVRKTPVIVVPHGVDLWPMPARDPESIDGTLNFLHVTGAVSFPHRKGTPALLRAWKDIESEFHGMHLTLKMYKEPRMMEYIKRLGVERIIVDDTPTLAPQEMANYLNRFDAVVQPSRGEGFGMVPLEARSLGIPAILTGIAGHSEHFAPGVDIEVPVGSYKPMVTQGNADGFAPTVEAEHVEQALRTFLADINGHKNRAKQWATRFRDMWQWRNVLKPLMNTVIPAAKRKGRIIKLVDSIGG